MLDFLKGAATGAGGELASELALAVLERATHLATSWVRLALDVRVEPAASPGHAVTLAGLVLGAEASRRPR